MPFLSRIRPTANRWPYTVNLLPKSACDTAAFSQQPSERRKDLEQQAGQKAITSNKEGPGLLDDSVDKNTAAAAAVAAGEKKVVALLPTEQEQIKHREHEVIPYSTPTCSK